MSNMINEINAYSGEIRDIIIAIKEAAKVDAKEVIVVFFDKHGEVQIKVRK